MTDQEIEMQLGAALNDPKSYDFVPKFFEGQMMEIRLNYQKETQLLQLVYTFRFRDETWQAEDHRWWSDVRTKVEKGALRN